MASTDQHSAPPATSNSSSPAAIFFDGLEEREYDSSNFDLNSATSETVNVAWPPCPSAYLPSFDDDTLLLRKALGSPHQPASPLNPGQLRAEVLHTAPTFTHMLRTSQIPLPVADTGCKHSTLAKVMTPRGLVITVPRNQLDPPPRPVLLEIFSGKEARITQAALRTHMVALPPVDILHDADHDLTKPQHLQTLLTTIRTQQPKVTFLAPPCTAYSIALRNFNKHRPQYIAERQQRDTPLRLATLAIIKELISYGGDFILENPTSRFS